MYSVFANSIILFLLFPAIILAVYAQTNQRRVFEKHAKESNKIGLTGAEVTAKLLKSHELDHVLVELTDEKLGDHYDPRHKIIRLSSEVYHSSSITSLGIAAHEIGHALQHEESYIPLVIRNTFVPMTRAGSHFALPLLLLGIIFSIEAWISLGIVIFFVIFIFQVITLPVEYNASKRALTMLEKNDLIKPSEFKAIDSVLRAATLTYLAAAVMSFANLTRLFSLSGFYNDRG